MFKKSLVIYNQYYLRQRINKHKISSRENTNKNNDYHYNVPSTAVGTIFFEKVLKITQSNP